MKPSRQAGPLGNLRTNSRNPEKPDDLAAALSGPHAGDEELEAGEVPLPRIPEVDPEIIPRRQFLAEDFSQGRDLVDRGRTFESDDSEIGSVDRHGTIYPFRAERVKTDRDSIEHRVTGCRPTTCPGRQREAALMTSVPRGRP